jgi:hypothetical protein
MGRQLMMALGTAFEVASAECFMFHRSTLEERAVESRPQYTLRAMASEASYLKARCSVPSR